jgi:putative membrane protein
MKRIGSLLIALAVSTTFACNRANNRDDVAANNTADNTVGTAGDTTPSSGDRDFIERHLEGGMAEVELGKMAAEKGSSAEVKRFGQMMVTDHTKAGDELKQIAAQYNIAPPAQLNDEHRDLRDKLSKLQGAEFDREYMKAMVDDHEKDADNLESRIDKNNDNGIAGTTGSNDRAAQAVTPEHSDNPATMSINQWAATAYPTVEMHLDHAKSMNDQLDKRGRNTTR